MTLYLIIAVAAWYVAVLCFWNVLLRAEQVLSSGSRVIET